MAKDEELFEEAMQTLGIKPSARAKPPKREGAGGVGVTVSEDLDFDALMREGRGPAKEVRGAPGPKKGPDAEATAPAVGQSPATQRPVERSRHVASPEETREFLAAMADLGTPPVGEREPASEPRNAPRSGTSHESDLGRRLKRGDVEVDAVLDLHGSNRKEARPKLGAFIKEAVEERWELIAIVTGRGLNSQRDPVLRPAVEAWLREDHRAEVSEIHPAPPYLGGSGAWIAAIRVARGR